MIKVGGVNILGINICEQKEDLILDNILIEDDSEEKEEIKKQWEQLSLEFKEWD